MERVNFTTSFGDQVTFDENGDAYPIYDIMNWLQLPDGKTKVQSVGEVKRSVSKGEELRIDDDKIFWNFDLKKVNSPYYFGIACNNDISCISHV